MKLLSLSKVMMMLLFAKTGCNCQRYPKQHVETTAKIKNLDIDLQLPVITRSSVLQKLKQMKRKSSRKIGATSLNSKSSRSHMIFTIVIKSWCKGASTNGFSSSKSSRISLIDLAGQDRNKVDGAGRQCLRETKNVKKSLSQLGHVVDALTKETSSGKAEVPNKNSCLTRLLHESLGGNAKLSVISSIYPNNKNNGETLHTLRFGQQARSIQNEPVINEIKEDDVNDLSDQIRQLKEELIRAKDDARSSDGNKNGYLHVHNVWDSLNHLRVSLNRSLLLPNIDNNDIYEEVNVSVEDIKHLREQIDEIYSSCEGNPIDVPLSEDCVEYYSVEENCGADIFCGDEVENGEECLGEPFSKLYPEDSVASDGTLYASANYSSRAIRSSFTDSISVSLSYRSPILLEEPQLIESPKIRNIQRKSVAFSSSCLGISNKLEEENSSSNNDMLGKPSTKDELIQSSLRLSKVFPSPIESLAASLKRGLQIIDCHQQNSTLNKPSSSFSFDRLTLTPYPEIKLQR